MQIWCRKSNAIKIRIRMCMNKDTNNFQRTRSSRISRPFSVFIGLFKSYLHPAESSSSERSSVESSCSYCKLVNCVSEIWIQRTANLALPCQVMHYAGDKPEKFRSLFTHRKAKIPFMSQINCRRRHQLCDASSQCLCLLLQAESGQVRIHCFWF